MLQHNPLSIHNDRFYSDPEYPEPSKASSYQFNNATPTA